MGYVVAGILILSAVAWAAVNAGYLSFAAVMSVANAVNDRPVVFLHDRIMREAEAGTTIRYEVVRLPGASAYRDRYSDHLVVFEAANKSRWPVTSISPRCMLAFADGGWTDLTMDARAERARLDDAGHVSTGVPAGGTLQVSLRTATVRHESRVVRADCTFDIAVPWYFSASEMPRVGGRG